MLRERSPEIALPSASRGRFIAIGQSWLATGAKDYEQPDPFVNGQHTFTVLSALRVIVVSLLSGSWPLSMAPLQPPCAVEGAHSKEALAGSPCNFTTVPAASVTLLIAPVAPFGKAVPAGCVT